MSLYRVHSHDGRPIWLAYEDTETARIYVYVPNTGQFHHHRPLGADFYWDRELGYEALDTDTATELIAQGTLGKLDGRSHANLLADFRGDPQPLTVDAVIGAQPMDHEPSPRQQAAAKAAQIAATAAGQWTTWKVYSSEARQRAYVAAHDLRVGKVKALRTAGVQLVDTRVTPTKDGRHAVQVTKKAPGRRVTG